MASSSRTKSLSTISYDQLVSENPRASYHLVFMITGNPGLISYYNTFLSTLHKLLTDSKPDAEVFHIYGQNLAGFEQDDRPSPATSSPYSLEDQIEILLNVLDGKNIPSGPRKGQKYDSIILMGHSVGTYIIMEILNRLREIGLPLKVKAALMLFPTVTHLSKSPSGIKFRLFFKIPGFPRALSLAGKTLLWPIPRPTLKWLVGLVLGMPEDGAETTTNFLTSSMGTWQSLHLAKEEFECITEDKWDDEIWGVEHTEPENVGSVPKLIFYFAEQDHWVANHIRDELIAVRGKGKADISNTKPLMLIDENKVPHSFCINHSEQIAEKVKLWIDDLLELSP